MNHVTKSISAKARATDHDEMKFVAPFYDKLINLLTLGRAKKMRQATLDLANILPTDHVLDVGCGTGDLSIFAASITPAVVGIDVSEPMIAQAQRKATKLHNAPTFDLASIANLPYPANSFDVVLSSLMIHHLAAEEQTEGFREVYRVLRENGRFLIVDLDPTQRGLATRLHTALGMKKSIDYVRDVLPEQLKRAGFAIVTTGKLPLKQMSYALATKQGG